MRQEDFRIDTEIIKQFISENNGWKRKHCSERYVYLNFSMVRLQAAWIIPKILYAKGIEESTGATVIVLTWGKNHLLTSLLESFGMQHVPIESINQKSPLCFIKAIVKTVGFMITDGTGMGLQNLHINRIAVGKSIYEDIIRTSRLSTIKKARNLICTKKLLHLAWTIYSFDKYVQRKKPLVFVADDIAYHEAALIKTAVKNGAYAVLASNWSERRVIFDDNGNIETHSMFRNTCLRRNWDCIKDDSWDWSQKYLEERFQGKNGRNIDRGAFAGKNVVGKEWLISEMGLDTEKKNVVIMAHTFSDAVFNYGELYFRDYYDWLEKTLDIAVKNNSVNWILKPHPTRHAYNESRDSIENMFDRYKKQGNLFLLSDDISTESLKDIADVIVTIGGNAGAEFSCLGIPSIIVGKPYYSGLGFTIEPSTYNEYKETLLNVNRVKKLTTEQIEIARRTFAFINNNEYVDYFGGFHDAFAEMINTNYKRMVDTMALEYFASDNGTDMYNNEILKKITEYMRDNEIRDSAYYQSGKKIGKDLREQLI